MDQVAGTQIAYVPDHAEGDINHSDVQFGFVTSIAEGTEGDLFCRYWKSRTSIDLRTKANSERTPIMNIKYIDTRSQDFVDTTVKELYHG